jgi:SAM-dependent MidA family methyltransferase
VQTQTAHFPVPSVEALAHSDRLKQYIVKDIERSGDRITFARFMELVLYSPGLGYYSSGSVKLGKDGDFITAPEVSPLFSRCIARSIIPVLSEMESPAILEVGAGSGVMASDILLEIENSAFSLNHYAILERSADLIQRQQQTMLQRVPQWRERIEWWHEIPQKMQRIIIANELLDALPVHRVAYVDGEWQELNVRVDNQGCFDWCIGALSDPRLLVRMQQLEHRYGTFTDGFVTEINLAAEDWLKTMADQLQQGIILLIDYGQTQSSYYHPERNQGTLMCHYRHQAHGDPFAFIGLQDITAHVDFTAMADKALEAGLAVNGFTTQAHFLLGSGITQMCQENEDVKKQLDFANQVKKLTLPQEMGETFKVIAFSKNVDVPLPGFQFRDMRDLL